MSPFISHQEENHRERSDFRAVPDRHRIGPSDARGGGPHVLGGDAVMPVHPVFKMAAERLGWRWSAPHNGLIHDSHTRPPYDPQRERGYIVAVDFEDACNLSGIDTVEEALRYCAWKDA